MSAVAEQLAPQSPNVTARPWDPGIFGRLVDVWRYRSLIPYVGKQFIVKRYRKTYLGLVWIPLRPAIDLASRAFLFGGLLSVSSGDRPYFIFIAFATAGWMIFDASVRWGIRSVRVIRSLARGVYMPRTLGVVGCLFPAMLDYVLYSFVAFAGIGYFLIVDGTNYLAPPQQMIVALGGIGLVALFGLSLALWIGPLAEYTKEVRYVMAYVLQFWYFVTPVIYAIDKLPKQYQGVAIYNPLTAPIEMIKFGLLSTAAPETRSLIAHFSVLTVLLLGGLWFSSRAERAAVARL